MNYFINIVMEKDERLNEGLDKSIFPEQEVFTTEQDCSVLQVPLPRELSEEEADEYANRLANFMFESGYEDFDIEVRGDDLEEADEITYEDDDEFFEDYGVMWFNEDEEKLDERSKFAQYRNLLIVYDPKTMEVTKTYPHTNAVTARRDASKSKLPIVNGAEFMELMVSKYGMTNALAKAKDMMPVAEDEDLDEAKAKYRGRPVKLGKPMAGDVAKFKVYVRNPKGNVVKVNFGQKGSKIKKSNPERRRSFRARHNCDNPGPRHKARYWSCRKW